MKSFALATGLILALSLALFAQVETRATPSLRVNHVETELVELDAYGPYRPIVVEISIPGLEKADGDDVRVTLDSMRGFSLYDRSHRIAPNGTLRVEIPAPSFGQPYFQLKVRQRSTGRESREFIGFSQSHRSPGTTTPSEATALLIGGPETGRNTFNFARIDLDTAALSNPEGLRRWQSYLAVDLVILDGEAVADLHPDARRAIRTWTECGGSLWVHATSAADQAALARMIPGLPESFGADAAGRNVGFGRVVFQRDTPLRGEAGMNATLDALLGSGNVRARLCANERFDPEWARRGSAHFRPVFMSSGYHPNPLRLPGLGGVSAKTFAFVILVFGIIVGPINYILLARWRRKIWALATIPLLSFVAFFGIVGYALVTEGRDVLVLSRTLTVLDQTTHRAATHADRAYYTGLTPTEGFQYEGDLAIVPSSLNLIAFNEGRYGVDWSEGSRAFGAWVPARATSIVKTAGVRDARERLEIEAEGSGRAVRNSLGVDIERLLLRDREGRLWTSGPVATGDRVTLAPAAPTTKPTDFITSEDAAGAGKKWHQADFGALEDDLRPREYFVRLKAPLRPNYGTDRAEPLPGLHLLRGNY